MTPTAATAQRSCDFVVGKLQVESNDAQRQLPEGKTMRVDTNSERDGGKCFFASGTPNTIRDAFILEVWDERRFNFWSPT